MDMIRFAMEPEFKMLGDQCRIRSCPTIKHKLALLIPRLGLL